MKIAIGWIHCDLRLHDNQALAQVETVVPVFKEARERALAVYQAMRPESGAKRRWT